MDEYPATVAVAETFISIQGEGAWVGMPMFFIRLAGCNLSCPWCDTDHSMQEMPSVGALLCRAVNGRLHHVCITGGEPTAQPEALAGLIAALRAAGFVIHLETNGTGQVPEDTDWVTVSPKGAPLVVCRCEDVKVVLQVGDQLPDVFGLPEAWCYYAVPEAGQGKEAVEWVIALVMKQTSTRPWLLGVQMHKLIGLR
jgi:organic radical activating enzyme